MNRSRRNVLTSALVLLTVSALGCGGNHVPPATIDANVARQSLEKALAAWKNDAKPESLKEDAKSPIHVADEDWLMGFKLQGFDMPQSDPKAMTAATVRFEVNLNLTSPKGQRIQKKAQYSVTTSPSISVIREETNV